ncbi:hypothetical protein NL676_003390 [Syzygium grande]|nr:hypothetical protein NL676_003390 [Syzygium grande]
MTRNLISISQLTKDTETEIDSDRSRRVGNPVSIEPDFSRPRLPLDIRRETSVESLHASGPRTRGQRIRAILPSENVYGSGGGRNGSRPEYVIRRCAWVDGESCRELARWYALRDDTKRRRTRKKGNEE